MVDMDGYTTLFRQILFRQTLFRQSTVGTSGIASRLQYRPTGSTDWKDEEPNPENQGAIIEPHWVWHFKILVRKFEKPDLICMGFKLHSASINTVLSMHTTP